MRKLGLMIVISVVTLIFSYGSAQAETIGYMENGALVRVQSQAGECNA